MDRATVLIVDDDEALREGLIETVAAFGHLPVAVGDGKTALTAIEAGGAAIRAVILDLRMPGQIDGMETLRRIRAMEAPPPVAVLTAFASADSTIETMRLGAFDHLTKPVGREDLRDLLSRMIAEGTAAPQTAPVEPEEETLIGVSDAMHKVQKLIGLSAASEATVLVMGETGTGKEMIARALHAHAPARRHRPFVAINAAAIPMDLLESELFGHVKGGFTGAVADRPGAFRDADGGTLLLDEIGDMPLSTQAKLLRVLQDGIVTPVGGRPVRVDVRLVAATHRDLPQLVSTGAFRADLYYRLNVVPIMLPPLRERLADIIPLAEHFLSRAARGGVPKRLSPAAAARLLAHPFPGNVRELRNVLERATVFVQGSTIDAADLDLEESGMQPKPPTDWLAGDLATAVERIEVAMIRKALADAGGNRSAAARALGIHRQHLYTKIARYRLEDAGLSG